MIINILHYYNNVELNREIREVINAIELYKGFNSDDWSSFKTILSNKESALWDELYSSIQVNDQELSKKFTYRVRYQLLCRLSDLLSGQSSINANNKLLKDRQKVQSRYYCMNLLKGTSFTHSAVWMANINIKEAIRLDMVLIVLDTARYLARVYSTRKFNPTAANKYTEIANLYESVLHEEGIIEQQYNSLIRNFIQAKSINKACGEIILSEYEPEIGNRSYSYILCHGLIKLNKYEIIGDLAGLIRSAQFYYLEFEKKKYDYKGAKSLILTSKVSAHLQLKQYVEAQQTLGLLFTQVPHSSNNWFDAQDLQIRLSLAVQDFGKAHNHFQKLQKCKNLGNQPKDKRDLYMIYGLYTNFLVLSGQIPNASPWSKRKTTAYFRSTTVFDRDTRGVRVAMIIAELLYNIIELDYDAIENRIHSLKEYCSRYLKKNGENYRSNCFIKMLLEIPKANFHPEAARRKAANYHQKLLNHPLEIAMQPREVEIIPFEQLWHIIIHYLRSPKRKRKNAMELSAFNL